jgi:hypothetical protein
MIFYQRSGCSTNQDSIIPSSDVTVSRPALSRMEKILIISLSYSGHRRVL